MVEIEVSFGGLDLFVGAQFPVKTVLVNADDLALRVGHIVDAQLLHDPLAHGRLRDTRNKSRLKTPAEFARRRRPYLSGRRAAGHPDDEGTFPGAHHAVSVGRVAGLFVFGRHAIRSAASRWQGQEKTS